MSAATPTATAAPAAPRAAPARPATARANGADAKSADAKSADAKSAAAKSADAKSADAKSAAADNDDDDTGSGGINVEDVIKAGDALNSMRTKAMWAGALTPIEDTELCGLYEENGALDAGGGDGKSDGARYALRPLENPHAPALLKAFDELMVNASDAVKAAQARGFKGVAYIRIAYLGDLFSVENNAAGIPVLVDEKETRAARANGATRDVYGPELAFAQATAGTNSEKKGLAAVKGGTNGVGGKIANVHSREFRVDNTDAAGRRFQQVFWDRLRCVGAPVITKVAARAAAARVKITMWPAYAALKYGVLRLPLKTPYTLRGAHYETNKPAELRVAASEQLAPALAADIEAYVRLRAHQIAAYLGPKVAVSFNGHTCACANAGDLARLLGDAPAAVVRFKASADNASAAATKQYSFADFAKHAWEVAVCVAPPGAKPRKHVAVVNGVNSNAGTHITYIKEALGAAVAAKYEKLVGKKKTAADKKEKALGVAETLKHVRLVVCATIPFCDWAAQRKNKVEMPRAVLSFFAPAPKALAEVAGVVAERMLVGAGARRFATDIDKYSAARRVGRGSNERLMLLAAEGDSAISLLKKGLGRNDRLRGAAADKLAARRDFFVPNFDYCGIISLGGVIVNAAREVKDVETSDGSEILVASEKLKGNKKVQGILNAMRLDVNCRYERKEDIDALAYGHFCVFTDQDLDGTGKIATLVLSLFTAMFPGLVAAGRIWRAVTPVVRMYARKKGAPPLEFAYEAEARDYLAAHPAWARTHHPPKFFKGLAGHNDKDLARMFEPVAFNAALFRFRLDDAGRRLYGVYCGKDAAPRRAALRAPTAYPTPAQLAGFKARREIPCAVHYAVDTHAYKLGAIARQIPHLYTGLVPTVVKTVDALGDIYGTANRLMKIFQLAARVAIERHYHHGEASINGTVTGLAQTYQGANQIPLLVSNGQVGTRRLAGEDAGQPRYVDVRMCPVVPLLFPAEDRWLLPFNFEDGARSEPRYFLPPLPLAVLETGGSRPSEGWRHASYARDYAAVMRVVTALLAGDPALTAAAEALHAGKPTVPAAAMAAFPDLTGSDVATLKSAAAKPAPLKSAAAKPAPLKSAAATLKPAAVGDGETEVKLEDALHALEAAYPLPPSAYKFKGRFVTHEGKTYSVGACKLDGDVLKITELPLGAAAGYDEAKCPGFIGGLKKMLEKKVIKSFTDYSAEDDVDITVVLNKGAKEMFKTKGPFDGPTEFFKLRKAMDKYLNFIGPDGTVRECGSYLEVLLHWFAPRRDLYRRRLERQRVLAALRVIELENIQRYAAEYDTLGLKKLTAEAAEAKLAEREYTALNAAALHAPKFVETAAICGAVLGVNTPGAKTPDGKTPDGKTPDAKEPGVDTLEAAAEPDESARGKVNYAYLLDLTDRQKLTKAVEARAKALAAQKEELRRIDGWLAEKPAGLTLWRAEIAALDACIKRGVETNWRFDFD